MSELERSLKRLRGLARHAEKVEVLKVHLAPDSAFDALLEQRIHALEGSLEELKGRVNGLLFLVVGAVLVQIILGFLK